jgi:formate dehydrogenase assembly factor FdhD
MNVINEIKTLLGMEVNLAQMKLKDGVTVIEAEMFEAEQAVFIVNGEEKVPVPVGEYELEDGTILVVAVEGIIAEIKQAEVEVEEPEAEVEVEVEAQAEPATPKRIVESVSKEMFFAEIEKLQAQIAELKSVKQELSSDVIVEPLTHSPEVRNEVKLNKLSPNRQMTTQDIVMAKLFN